MSNIDISIILPAYEESKNLAELLPRINDTLQGKEFEILVIDTTEPLDNSREVCNLNGANCIPRQGGNTFGDAVRSGIKASQGRILVFMDADCSHDPEFIPSLLDCIEEYDVVIASRYIEEGYSENNFMLRGMSRILNTTYSFILSIPCKDVSNSFKAYHANSLKKIELTCNNFDVVEEILFKLSRQLKQIRIKEIPFNFKKREHGTTKRNLVSFIFTYLITILKLRFGK